ncbi:hypothetical protein BDN72DRAFT_903122 [Pluteus cervinus]|uniref:Uncharacterized protein n=1 Tax=Pluteus cervinus TaxID=181527 RepID=A0ACD3ACJ5_9AGAR|nr:hypothetical protein BDN72DRAFT_903122 [Pluteus cervinus]
MSTNPILSAHSFLHDPADDDHSDTASQRSISLSSPPISPRNSIPLDHHYSTSSARLSNDLSKRVSQPYTIETDLSSEVDGSSVYTRDTGPHDSPSTSAPPSEYDDPKEQHSAPIYPPIQPKADDTLSIASFASGSSRKARPESMLVGLTGPIVLGVALVDFNHIVGPRIEYHKDAIFEDEEVIKILPFLALPDGAHLSAEDYSYFHLVTSGPNPRTIFGISCNQQIAASALLVRSSDVTRSTVQKAVVVLASKPVFGPIRDKLGVVTTALFQQLDFSQTTILDEFSSSLEASLRSQMTESGLYMGTNLRQLVHTFRHRTLTLIKALILQRRIMFYGHPVERLCTYQYSLVSLLPGLLQTLDDCGSPSLANRAPTLSRPTELKTSDRKSMMAFTGFPLDIFGKDSFFQPYLPLQQMDTLKETPSWLCGSTNSIVTSQKEIDLLVDIELGSIEFRNPDVERAAGLTAADRKWMDEIVLDVNATWDEEDPTRPTSMQFKGSDDYLRAKLEEYISAALSSLRYRDFVTKEDGKGVLITGGTGGDSNAVEDFNPLWLGEFKRTNAYDVWEKTTDPLLFDIVEPRHPCNEKPTVVGDIGLRLAEGIQELKLDQSLAPAREAVARTLTVGSSNFFKAVEGVRDRWTAQRSVSSSGVSRTSDDTMVEVTQKDLDGPQQQPSTPASVPTAPRMSWLTRQWSSSESSSSSSASPTSGGAPQTPPKSNRDSGASEGGSASSSASASLTGTPGGGWGIGSFLSKAPRFSLSRTTSRTEEEQQEERVAAGPPTIPAKSPQLRSLSLSQTQPPQGHKPLTLTVPAGGNTGGYVVDQVPTPTQSSVRGGGGGAAGGRRSPQDALGMGVGVGATGSRMGALRTPVTPVTPKAFEVLGGGGGEPVTPTGGMLGVNGGRGEVEQDEQEMEVEQEPEFAAVAL